MNRIIETVDGWKLHDRNVVMLSDFAFTHILADFVYI